MATSRNIAGVAFNGSSSIDIPYANLSSIPTTWTTTQIPTLAITKISGLQGALDAKQATINSTAGHLIIGNGNGATTTNTGLTWTTATNLLTATNLAVSTYATITRELTGVFSGSVSR